MSNIILLTGRFGKINISKRPYKGYLSEAAKVANIKRITTKIVLMFLYPIR